MHNDQRSNVVSLSEWPKIPKTSPESPGPESLAESNLGEIVQGVLDTMRRDGGANRSEHLAHIRNFRSPAYRLVDDLAISIEETPDGFIARSHDTGQYGWGVCSDDAIGNLCGVLEDYYETLLEEKGNLSASLEAHLRYLASVLIPT